MSFTLRPRDMSAHPKNVEDENGAGHATSGGGIADSVTYHFTAHDHKGRHIGKVSVNDGFGRDNEFKVKFAPKGAKGAAAKGTDITHAIPQADRFDIDRSYTGNNADHAYDHGVAAITGYLGKPARKRDNFKIESAETPKKSLVESAVELMSQQSDMGHRQTINESRKVDHEADFKDSFAKHVRFMAAAKSEPDPKMRKVLSKTSQTNLDLAHLHAHMHYHKKGTPIKVSGNDYDEFISSLRHPLVVKK